MTGLERLGAIWKDTPNAELEAMITDLDLTGWQDVIQYLRSLGMRDAPQTVKLNICLSNDIRITLTGAGVIQAYCKDNRIADKPFVAMIKETIADADPVDLAAYGARVKLKREIPLAKNDPRLVDVLANWDKLAKHFRNIQRFEFVAPSNLGLRFDISLVRENADRRTARTFQEARITAQPPRYEVEAEVTAVRARTSARQAAELVIRGLGWLLQGRQRSFVLVSRAGSDSVLTSINDIFRPPSASGSRNRSRGRNGNSTPSGFRFPGPQPATLERPNMAEAGEAEAGIPNIRSGYNVTDKADGLRCLLYVAENGRIFLVDGGARVYGTGLQVERGAAGVVLDGEWIKKNRRGEPVSHYYGFDILAGPKGDTSVSQLPFLIEGAMLGAAAAENTRMTVLSSIVKMLGSATPYQVGIPPVFQLQIGMKTFRTGANLFRDAITPMLDDARAAPYATDGLIFTPNAAPLPLGGGTWAAQLKWKPPHENTIDFLVAFEKEKGGSIDLMGTKFREDSGQTVRYKTMRLFVGSSRDVAFADPRATILGGEPLPASLEEGEYRPVEFRPMEPRDPMASTCYIAIGEGASDPAAATRAATILDPGAEEARATRTGDILQNNMIVEMAYHPERAPGWRWEPVRVRFDKTERFAAGQKRGTMNADWVASSIWSSLHNPVTEEMIRSGTVIACLAPSAIVAPSTYYNRRAPARDMMKVQCLRNFHNDVVKRDILLRKTVRPGAALCDLAMGKAGDLHKWISTGVGRVFGCDIAAANLNDPEDGAYRRLLDKMVSMGGRDRVPPMTFVQADASKRLSDGSAGVTAEDRALLMSTFAPSASGSGQFDVVSCMFATHYMFRDENTLAGFLTNLADTVKVGGYFVGCGFDGDAVARLLAAEPTAVGQDGATDVWAITKRYGTAIGSSVPASAAGLGLTVDVDFISIGDTHPEYLVSFPYLQSRLAEAGLDLLTPGELLERGLPASSQMFGETWAATTGAGKPYNMSEAEKRLSFLNRWYIFVRRSERRPAPGSLVESAPAAAAAAPAAPAAPASPTGAGAGVVESKGGEEVGLDVIELPAAAAVEDKQYRVDASTVTADLRLGPEFSDWPRYLSMGTLVEIPDAGLPGVRYPSVEAAIASAKYQRATDKPDLGAKLFAIDGLVDKKYKGDRERAVAARDDVAVRKTVDDQVAMTRLVSGKNKIKANKAEWNQGAWDAARDEVYRAYLTERLRADGRFRAILEAIKAKAGEILFVNGVEPSELGVGVRVDGSLVGGDNLVGQWMMRLV
jgi:hypothetical protein